MISAHKYGELLRKCERYEPWCLNESHTQRHFGAEMLHVKDVLLDFCLQLSLTVMWRAGQPMAPTFGHFV